MPKETKDEPKQFKVIEENVKDAPVEGDIEWEGEEVHAESDTKITDDKGKGYPVMLRFFTFASNPDVFRMHKPSAQELFDSHRKGIESLLWRDALRPLDAVEPRLMFSKDKKYYRFIITCIPMEVLVDTPKTLSELLAKQST